jgi:autotransporter-associated beta strand protein
VVTGTDTGSTDVATFNQNLNLGVTVDAYRNMKSLVFLPGVDAFNIQGGTLALSDAGSVVVAGGVTRPQTISSPVLFVPAAASGIFTSNSRNEDVSLILSGDIAGQRPTGSATSLILNGSGEGNITGILGNGSAGGKVSIAKGGGGSWTLTGANTFSGGLTANNGNLILDHATQATIVPASNPVAMGGGTLVLKGRSSGSTPISLGALSLTASKGANTIVVDKNGGAGTTLTLANSWTRNGGANLLFDLSSGSVLISSPTLTNSVVTGASGTAAGFLVKDETGKVDYASRDATNRIVRLETVTGAAVTEYTGAAVAVTTKNYKISADTSLAGGTNTFGTVRIDASANPVAVSLGATDFLLGKSVMIVDGSNDVSFTSTTGKLAQGGLVFANYNTATTTIGARIGVSTTAASFMGPGLTVLNFDNSGQDGASTIQGGILRLATTSALPTGNLSIQNGGILELGAADFTKGFGTGANLLQFNSGSGGYSAFGAPRTVNAGGAGATLTWGTGSFLADGSSLILGSRVSDNTLTFANPLGLNNGNRVVHVNDGVSGSNIDAILSGVISSGVDTSGMLTKAGPGTLALTATNTYAGGTNLLAGQLSIGNGTTGSISATGVMYNDAILAFNRSNTYTYGGSITGTGQVKQIGGGKLTLSGSNTYTGPTTASSGTLAGVGCAASDLIVQAATIEPGITVGTMFVADATFGPQSTTVVQVDGQASDRLMATGVIHLDGELIISPIGNGVTYSDYVIARGSGITGAYTKITAGFKVTYTATEAILNTVPTYLDWATLWAPGQSEGADHDGDGVANGVEYFMGTTGSSPTVIPGMVELNGIRTITWPKAITYFGLYAVDHVVQTSTNLQPEGQPGGWTDVPANLVIDSASSLSFALPQNEEKYFVRLKVIVREVPSIIPVPPTRIPPVPLGLAMTANSATSSTLTWYSSPVNDDVASHYLIYSSATTDGVYTQIGTSTTREFIHTGLATDSKRFYKVSAVNVVGESNQSAYTQGFTLIPSDGSGLPVLIAKNMCLTLNATIVSNVAPTSGTLGKLVDGLDATSCLIPGAHEVRIKLNTHLPFDDAQYLLLNFRTDQTGEAYPYNINYRSLKNYVITQSFDSTNGVDGTWSDVVTGSNTYLDGVVVIPNQNPKWIGIRNSGGIQLARLEIFRGAPEGYRNDYWIFAGDSLVVQDMVGGAANAHSVWFSDLVRQRHPDRYPIVVNSSQGGEMMVHTRSRLTNQLPVSCAPNGTSTPTGTFLCFETGFNDVGVGGGFWMGPNIINELTLTQNLCNTHGMLLVPVRIEYSTHLLNLDTLEPAGTTFFNTLAVNLSGVDVYTRKFAPYACDPVTQLPYADYWTYTRNNYATALASDGVHHTKAGSDGINTLWADVAGKMIYLKQP